MFDSLYGHRISFSNLHNPSSRTTALGSTDPPKELSTINLPRGKGRTEHKADKLTEIYETTVWKMWDPRCLNPYGSPCPVIGTILFLWKWWWPKSSTARNIPEEDEENQEGSSGKTVAISTEIRKEYFPHTNPERYHYINLFGV
jgi:hypothetical protein